MRIAIDARMWGLRHAGIGRYVENLVTNLIKLDKKNDYTLLVRKEDFDNIKISLPAGRQEMSNVKLVIAEARHYSVKEQIILPPLLNKEKFDLVHFPHFNVPVLYRGKYIVTIHDLLWHETKGHDVTTLSGPAYNLKYLGYKFVFARAVKRAQNILVPSHWVQNKLKTIYPDIPEDKIIVIYEGASNIQYPISNIQFPIKKPYLIYVGSAYPHKNLKVLLDTMQNLKDMKLVIACSRDVFWEKLKTMVSEYKLEDRVLLPGFVPDNEFANLYKNALAFVFPSFCEGFGLPGIEAMASGCPVIASDRGSLPEIYGDAALYFNPVDASELKNKILTLQRDNKLRSELINKGLQQVKKYSWEKMAKETLEVYESRNSL